MINKKSIIVSGIFLIDINKNTNSQKWSKFNYFDRLTAFTLFLFPVKISL